MSSLCFMRWAMFTRQLGASRSGATSRPAGARMAVCTLGGGPRRTPKRQWRGVWPLSRAAQQKAGRP
eukprot:12757555-Alexandrium_andersonii.AAC.1